MEKPIIKRKALSLIEKLEIIKKYDAEGGGKKTAFAKSIGIAESTLRTLLQKREEIEKNAALGGVKRKKIKGGKYEELENILFDWFSQARTTQNIPINGPLVKEKSKEIATSLGIENFEPSGGWLDRFKNRFGIVYKQISGESAAVNIVDADCWRKNVLPEITKEYANSDIFNADELGLFFKLMPDRTFALKGEKCHGGKLSKERVTVFIGANADGSEKLKPLVIGKSIKPRCFKNMKNLPCDYVNQNRAWMTAALFATRVRELDIQMQKNNRKILLFVDNCMAHTRDIPGLKNVRIEFLPPNSTSVLQPMDLGVIKVLKQQYRKRVVQRYLRNMEINEVRPITLLDAMYFLNAAWESVKPETVANCFRKAFATENDDVNIEIEDLNNYDLADLEEDWCAARKGFQDDSISLENYIDIDEGVCTSEVRSIDDIIKDAKAAEVALDEHDASYEADDDPEPLPIPTFSSVVTAFDVVRRYVSAMNGPSTEEIFRLINAAENAINKNRVLRQSKMDDFGHK